MPSDKASILAEKFEFCTVSKNKFLITENNFVKNLYILESGYVRSYILDKNEKEVTTNLFSPFCYINDVLAFFKKQKATESYQTLTDTKLWKMSYEDVQSNFHSIPEFREFGRMLLVTNYSILKDRMLGMVKDTAEERYQKLIKQNPEIFENVSLKIIASYLGITDSSLSRIRKKFIS